MSKIKVFGQAKKLVVSDVAIFNLNFYSEGNTNKKVIDEINANLEIFLEKLNDLGVDLKLVEQKSISINDSYRNNELFYNANREISFRLNYDAKIINYINDLISDMDGRVHLNLSYLISNEEELGKELIIEALNDSRNKAEIIASTLNQKVVSIDQANLDSSGQIYSPDLRLSATKAISYKESSLSNKLSAEKKELSAYIDVTWNIE